MANDLKRWLSDIGLGQHAERFAVAGIDLDVLADLTESDLKELGLNLGDRKRLLKALAAIDSSPPAMPDHSGARRRASAATEGGAERRQVTVMFVDLVDSTPLAERLDPEDLREVLRTFHETCARVIESEEGHISRYLGDGVLVYFGYPRAHEDDAPRAVRAGLRIVETLQAANDGLERDHGVRLRVRIGIHTGLVVVGEIGAGSARDRDAIVGETPNIAARLQAEAQPDALVLGDATQHLIEGLFELEDLGPRQLKGVSGTVRAWRAIRVIDAVDRFDARTRRGMTPFVGRAAELEMLNQRWAQACDGEMRCVLVAGEAGIGKSRLLRAFRDGLSDQAHETITLYCSPNHVNSAFVPLVDWMCRALQLNPRGDPGGSFATLAKAVTDLGLDDQQVTPVLSALLGLPAAGGSEAGDISTAMFKRRVVQAAAEVVAALAHRQPVVMVVEDAHWIDPSTHDLLRELLEQLTTLRLLLVITARPEFRPGWSYPHAVQINLDRLSRRDRAAMVERVAGGKKLPDFVLEQIITKTDGVPLFVEELTKTVLEGNILRDAGDRYELAGTFQGIAIPDTLQGSLLERLDRLPSEAKELAQIGAAIGRDFGRDLLALVAGRPVDTLTDALATLVAAEIIQPAPRSTWGQGAYAFRHALIQEAAYHSLLLVRRRQYHAAIADALIGRFPDLASMLPEVVAQHLTAADLPDRAIDAWLHAAEKAKRRGAFAESVAHAERGIELVRRLPEAARARSMVRLLLARAEVDTQLSDPRAISTLREVIRVVRAQGWSDELASAAMAFADAELWNNNPTTESVDLLKEALVAIGTVETVERCRVLSRLSRALLYVGAIESLHETMREARTLNQRFDDTHSLRDLLWCELMPFGRPPPSVGQFPERRRLLERLRQVAEQIDDYRYIANSMALSGPAFLEMGDVEAFEGIIERYATRYEGVGPFSQAPVDRWWVTSMRVMDAILKGEFALAERLATDAVEFGDDAQFKTPLGIYGMQMFTIRREQGRLAEVAPLLKRFVNEHSTDAAWRPGLMLLASDLGFTQQARKIFESLASADFAFADDSKRTVTLSYLSEVCCRLDDQVNAERLYELLQPYRDLAIVVGQSTVCCGAVGRFLGMLATTLRDWPLAEAHFEAALVMDERMKAWPWLAHSRFEYSRALLARGRKRDKLRAEELRSMALAAAERLGMGGLSRRIAGEAAPS